MASPTASAPTVDPAAIPVRSDTSNSAVASTLPTNASGMAASIRSYRDSSSNCPGSPETVLLVIPFTPRSNVLRSIDFKFAPNTSSEHTKSHERTNWNSPTMQRE
jgi:hypothetical protein